MILIFTGNGKGKTVAALGTALRALGHDFSVCMIQFMKGTRNSGEHKSIRRFIPNFEIIRGKTGFYKILNDTHTTQKHKQETQNLWRIAEEKIHSKKYNLIILDELNVALSLKMLPLQNVLNTFKKLPKNLHIIITGRNAPKKLCDLADLVTNMEEKKHPFQKNIPAQKGIDF